MPDSIRGTTARALVRWVSRWMEAAYSANCRGMPRWERMWAAGARQAQHLAFPVARRLDRHAMVEQMVEECWWG